MGVMTGLGTRGKLVLSAMLASVGMNLKMARDPGVGTTATPFTTGSYGGHSYPVSPGRGPSGAAKAKRAARKRKNVMRMKCR